MKKLFAILMSIMMIACFMPTMAFADGEQVRTLSFAQGENAVQDPLTATYGGTITPITVKSGDDAITSENEATYGTLSAEVSEGDAVTAAINDQKQLAITVVKAGTATVTVKAAPVEGSYAEGTATLNVTVAPKTLTGIDVSKVTVTKAYDGTLAAGTVGGDAIAFSGKVGNDDVSITATAEAYADQYVGNDKTVTLNLSLAGANEGNYALAENDKTQQFKTAKITAATQTITPTSAELKAGKTLDLSETFKSNAKNATLTFELTSDSTEGAASLDGTTLTGIKEGTVKIKVSSPKVDEGGSDAAEYTALADNTTVTVNVTPKETIEADKITFENQNVTYGETYTPNVATLTEEVGEEGAWTYSYAGTGETIYAANKVPPTKAGTYTVTAKYESENKVGTKEATLTINKKEVTIQGVTIADKIYDGKTDATIQDGAITLVGVVEADADKVRLDAQNATAAFKTKDAGNAKEVTVSGYTLAGNEADLANYELKQPTGVTATINKAPLNITGAVIEEKEYDHDNGATVNSLAFTGLVDKEKLDASDYEVDAYFIDGPDVGTDKDVIVEVTLKPNGPVAKNYVLDLKGEDYIPAKGTITQATKTPAPTAEVTVQKGTYGFVDIHSAIEADGATGEISVPADKAAFFTTEGKPRVNPKGLLEFTLSGTASDTVVITVPVERARNYKNYEIAVTVTVSDTEQVNVSAPRALDRVYDGTTKPLVEAGVLSSEKYKLQYAVDDGEFGFEIPTKKDVNVEDNGDTKAYTVKYKVVSVDETGDVTDKKTDFDPVEVRIEKKEVTYAPENITLTEGSALPTPVLKWDGVISSEEPLEAQLKEFAAKAKFEYRNNDDQKIENPAVPGEYRIVCINTSEFGYTDYNYDVHHGEGILKINKNSGSGGGSYYPYTPSTPSTPSAPNLDKTKTDSTTALNAAAAANKYDAAEQAEVKKILDKANADIKNAKTEAEVKAIEEAAQAEIDKILTTEEKAIVAALDNVEKRDFATKSKVITRKGGKKVIRLTWTAPDGVDVDGYEIFRSTKKNSGFGKKPYFTTSNTSYTNTKDLKAGKTYYYKVRAFVVINGERVYTDYSLKAYRKL